MFPDFPDIAFPAVGGLNGAKFESRSAMGRKVRARSVICVGVVLIVAAYEARHDVPGECR